MVIENIRICLNEDRPSANITSPGPIPVNLEVSQLNICRGSDGIFHIESPGKYKLNTFILHKLRERKVKTRTRN